MWIYPNIDPIIFDLGFLQVRWYGVMYLLSFIMIWYLASIKNKKIFLFNKEQLENLIFYGVLGTVIGGKVGYVLFYDFSGFINNPFILFKIWQGGMSFHGGFIGVITALYFFAKSNKLDIFRVYDFIAIFAPIGLGLGRLGNFINSELWGKVTDSPLGMYAPNSQGIWAVRHPSQLYEFFLEGVLLFVILWLVSLKNPPKKVLSALFLLLYGIFRFFIEFVRLPDAHIGYLYSDWLTLGQILSLPMIIFSIFIFYSIRKNEAIS